MAASITCTFVPAPMARPATARAQRLTVAATPIMRVGHARDLLVSVPVAAHAQGPEPVSPHSPRRVATSAFAIPIESLGHHQLQHRQGQRQQGWLGDVADFASQLLKELQGQQAQDEDEEWRRVFGQYLDPQEEAHEKHHMYKSHLAERFATERR